jgi:hypothetical protein
MSGNIVLADVAGVAELLPLLGQERLLFSLRTPGHESSVNFNDYHAIIYNVEKRFQTTDREQTLIINWTTLEHYKNLHTKISKSFNGMISTMVSEILSSDNFLGSKKPLHIDMTKNIRKYVIPNLNPFQTINLLKEEAVSGDMTPHLISSNGTLFRYVCKPKDKEKARKMSKIIKRISHTTKGKQARQKAQDTKKFRYN